MAKTLIGIFSLSIVVAIFVIPTPTSASSETDRANDTATTSSPTTDPSTTPSPTTDPSTTPSPTTDPSTTPSPTTDTATTPSPTTNTATTQSPTTATTDSKTTGPTTQTGSPPTVGSTTPLVTGSSSTKDPNSTPATPAPATTNLPSACATNPCLRGSTCEERANQKYICLCLPGDSYTDQGCQKSKVFPGLINWHKQFEDKMSDKTSTEFKGASDFITDQLDREFSGTGYTGSLVLELRESKQSKGRSTRGNIEASVQVIFEPSTSITDGTVNQRIKKIVCNGCPLNGTYTEKNLCDSNPCDVDSTKCDSANGDFTCQCQGGFLPSHLSDRVCVACPPGQKYDGSKCVHCGFGYSGVDCKDNVMLILVIVASILGGLLLIALILLPLVATKCKKKSSKSKEEDNIKPYISHSVAKAPLPSSNGFSSSSAKQSVDGPAANSWAPRFPRAATSTNWDSRTNLEMTPSNSRQNLIAPGKNSRFHDSQDDMFSFSQNQAKSNPYDQVQPKSNPYDQVQPKINPYSQVLPKNNPYDQVQPTTSLYSQVQPKSNPYVQNRATNPYAQSRGQTNPYFN